MNDERPKNEMVVNTESIIPDEAEKAGEVLSLANDALVSAGETTGGLVDFSEEEKVLVELGPELGSIGFADNFETITTIGGNSGGELIGGIADPDAITNVSQEDGILSLLSAEEIPIEKFFSLNIDDVYAILNPIKSKPEFSDKAQRILDLMRGGEDKYIRDNPEATSVTL